MSHPALLRHEAEAAAASPVFFNTGQGQIATATQATPGGRHGHHSGGLRSTGRRPGLDGAAAD